MNKLELFIAGCKDERWKWRLWRNSLFTVTQLPENHEPLHYDIDYRNDGTYWFDAESLDWKLIEDVKPLEAVYDNRELANFPEGSVPNHPDKIQTTYGRMLFNWMVMVYAFGDKFEFVHKANPKKIADKVIPHVVDEDENIESLGDGSKDKFVVYPSELERFVQALFETTSLCPYITPTGTEKSLCTHPDMKKRRKELEEKYTADGPMTQVKAAKMQEELVALDKEHLKGDDSEDFYLDGKSFNVRRKKMFGMWGVEASFQENGDFDLITKALDEGWDMSKLPAIYNSIREGSFDRGHDTALGGEKVTFMQRIYQNAKVIQGDCGTKLVDNTLITDQNRKHYIGMNIMEGGKPVELTNDNIASYIGKVVALRRPILCQAPNMDFCSVCGTNALAKNERAIAAEIAAVASRIMYAFMSSMHGTELTVARFNFKEHMN